MIIICKSACNNSYIVFVYVNIGIRWIYHKIYRDLVVKLSASFHNISGFTFILKNTFCKFLYAAKSVCTDMPIKFEVYYVIMYRQYNDNFINMIKLDQGNLVVRNPKGNPHIDFQQLISSNEFEAKKREEMAGKGKIQKEK